MTIGLIDELAGQGVAYMPVFPLGGLSPLQSSTLLTSWTRSAERERPSTRGQVEGRGFRTR
ncbi:hypothetical protein SAMN04487818_113119 [Actinokineospora terrae]|uniref:Uncharacterized protein n=1 Tax=Actinokineospora terrae TaxID=155974 RepID=A0A1H9X8R8_9PSEU|nr:hypothetical protein SAMN04487818_113119 [Actinokineospora terrae]